MLRVVLDTNVLIAAARSRRGASFRVLSLVGTGRFETALSVPLVLEYEEALLARTAPHAWSRAQVDDVLDYLCSVGFAVQPSFLWRPALPDPDDDFILDLAVAAGCTAIVTFNARDFRGAGAFGVAVWTPHQLLQQIGDIPWRR
jgi:putative PIN family toxin of toxin-antitoxin system